MSNGGIILDYDHSSGMKHTYHKDQMSGKVTIHSEQDATEILKQNNRERLASDTSWKGDLHKVASVPINVANAWAAELGDNPFAARNRRWLVAKLNSSEFGKFRTKEGRV
jgi:hypothetical protein